MSTRAVVWTAISLSAASCGFNPVGQNTQGNCTSGTGTVVLENMADEAVTVTLTGSGSGSDSSFVVDAGAVSVVDDPVGGYMLTATGMTSTSTLLAQSLEVLCNVDQEVVVPGGSDATLAVSLIGGGAGHVDSQAFAIACSTDDNGSASCTTAVVPNTSVTLTATADGGSTFVMWSGACGSSGTSSTCTLDVGSGASATAEFTLIPPTPEALTVALAGTGSGTVTSEPGMDISCSNDGGGAACMSSFNSGSAVTLVEVPAPSSVFAGWSGGGCSDTSASCITTISGAETVTATFTLATETLFVSTIGNGSVASNPSGLSVAANSSGSANFTFGQSVTLTPTASTNWAFSSWTGACTGSSTCTVPMTSAKDVGAVFTQSTYNVSVSFAAGTGTGTIAGGPIDCGSTCSGTVAQGTSITLVATPNAGSMFSAWSGTGCGTSVVPVCTISATAAPKAQFSLLTESLTVVAISDDGAGGTVTTSGFSCEAGTACSLITETYGTMVTLTATASADSTFTGWSGVSGCNTSTTCTVTLDAATTATATFAPTMETLNVAVTNAGSVTSNPVGILSCAASSGTCSASFVEGTAVTLTTSGAAATWTGCTAAGDNKSCTLTMNSTVNVTATF